MQAALERIQAEPKQVDEISTNDTALSPDLVSALQKLALALEAALPLLQSNGPTRDSQQQHQDTFKSNENDNDSNNNNEEPTVSATWLLNLLQPVPSALEPSQLAQAILDVSRLTTSIEQKQAALFDLLGESEPSIQALMEIAPRLDEIAQHISIASLTSNNQGSTSGDNSAVYVDLDEERRQLLRHEAMDTAQMAAIAKAELEALTSSSNSTFGTATHTVVSKQAEKQARKLAEKTAKRAAQALKKAQAAGAILETDDNNDWMEALLRNNTGTAGPGGLMNQSQDQVWALQQALLPEGSREYYDQRGLPHNAEHIQEDDMEKVIIPAVRRDQANLPARLKLKEIMDTHTLGLAFEGTTSLNPMQSVTFETAFYHRDNMLVCAPTGAGKTNVAMLTVVAHFRDVGLIGERPNKDNLALETGKKVIYIAPMKALAQEVVEKFSSKLKALKLIVRELTGDMQLSRAEADSANVIVTTPEKWDVVTRKSGTDERSLGNQCGLLIIDEVHLLADERGAVIESVVSRLHRLVESRQKQVRIVALSATLPNYEDVANFLQVPERGLFYFGPEHRPVPLKQQFIGVTTKKTNRFAREQRFNEICFDLVLEALQRGKQVMVFVHSRKGTGDTARALADIAAGEGLLERYFVPVGEDGSNAEAYKRHVAKVKKSRNREVSFHFANGMGIHHAGMVRSDRKLTEQMFYDGAIRVLCCTSTLAWGINLPSSMVVIKGTDVYNPEKGGNADLSILDVQQIFGRAGRPQFDTSGEAALITTLDAFPRYMDKLVRPTPIESNFSKQLADHLNAEIVGRTVTNIKEAATWLTYTYMYVRMLRNPLAYGISADEKADDPMLRKRCLELVTQAAKLLDSNRMVRFEPTSGNLAVVDTGRVAAHFYIQTESIETFNDMFSRASVPTDRDLCRILCSATEFRNMKLRQEELEELQTLAATACPLSLQGAGDDGAGRVLVTDASDKTFVLLQTYISRERIKSFTLISDMNYVNSNAARIARALFEMSIKKQEATASIKLLRIAKSVERQLWWFQTPLRHFENELEKQVYSALEGSGPNRYDSFASALSLLDMDAKEVGQLCKWNKGGGKIQHFVSLLPNLNVSCKVHPVTRSVLRFEVTVETTFKWVKRWHGSVQAFWLFVEDSDADRIYHHEYISFSHRTYAESLSLEMLIPVFDSVPEQYTVRFISDSFVGVESVLPVSLRDLKFPELQSVQTPVLDLTPLPVSALNEPQYEKLYTKFNTFNPIQTQLFHVLYHTDSPVFLGAPTGSGKTAVAELAILRMKRLHPDGICVYIAPLKALARERLKEWKKRLGSDPLKWSVLELSGDTSHDQSALEKADVLVCTPEKWDLVSRGWRGSAEALSKGGPSLGKKFIKKVRLLAIDEVHLLGEERGAVLEAIVSRTRFISRHLMEEDASTEKGAGTRTEMTRIIGLSTALANPVDLADWIGIDTKSFSPTKMRGLYNFRPSVRPVPVTVSVQGYSGRHYCPRMASMNKPCFAAIKELSPTKPALIFVASRRQTRLTAFDIISLAAGEENPKRFLHCDEVYAEAMVSKVSDEALRHTLLFGIGLHHAGLSSQDREIVEQMYLNRHIQILVATATLAWGLNTPSHLVIVKGTEFFDGKTSRYVPYPITDVLQMIGRAGRPGYDTEARAVVMVQEDQKNFYMKFLYSPFPVESCLQDKLPEILNAEISSGTIKSVVDAVGYMTWTFYARRMKANPSYYGIESGSEEHVELGLLKVVQEALTTLRENNCIEMEGDDDQADVAPGTLGIAATSYYLNHKTPKQMQRGIREARTLIASCLTESPKPSLAPREFTRSTRVDEISLAWLLYVLCSTHELDELPVRHNEELLNQELSESLMWGPDTASILSDNPDQVYHMPDVYADPHTKAFLLVQAYLEKAQLPISDYVNDTKSVLDNVPRLLAAMQFIASHNDTASGSLELLTQFARTKQYIESRSRVQDHPLQQLPGVHASTVRGLEKLLSSSTTSLYELRKLERSKVQSLFQKLQGRDRVKGSSLDGTLNGLYALPLVTVQSAVVRSDVLKTSGAVVGKLQLELTVERRRRGGGGSQQQQTRNNKRDCSLTILIGSLQQSILLGQSSVSLGGGSNNKFTVKRDVEFDWQVANADAGPDGGAIVVRFLLDQVRGLDLEQLVRLS